jgi:hypothetical protein
MAKVQSTVGPRVIHSFPKDGKLGGTPFEIPGAIERAGVKTNGMGEVPDAVLDEMILKCPVTRGWFESGELIDMRDQSARLAGAKAAKAAADKAAADAAAAAEAESKKQK